MAFVHPIPKVVVAERDELEQYRIQHLEGLEAGVKRGHGAYGSVYEVKVNGIPCIAKRLHDILVGHNISDKQRGESRRNFRRECQLLSRLRHPNIVQFLGVHYGSDPNDLTLVMEYLHTDLEDCLKQYKEAMPLSIKIAILLDVSYGLLHLHSQHPKIIHRDLTAGNVLLTPDMRAKLADLGVSKIIDFSLTTQMNRFTGCPGAVPYMPPEALCRDPKYDDKLDIFSFGILTLFVVIEHLPAYYIEAKISGESVHLGRAQIEKRRESIDKIPQKHCLREMILSCLMDEPGVRPSTVQINLQLKALSADHPKSFGNVIEMHQALKEGCPEQTQIDVVERDALLKQCEAFIQENTRLSNDLAAMAIQEKTYREDFAQERRDRENLAGRNEELERSVQKLTQDVERETGRNRELQQQLEQYRRDSMPRADQQGTAPEMQRIAQQYEASVFPQRIDPVTTPFPVGPILQPPHTLQYSDGSTQTGRGRQQYAAHTPARTQRQDRVPNVPPHHHVPQMATFQNSPPLVRKAYPAQALSDAFLGQTDTITVPHVSPTHRLAYDSHTPYSPAGTRELGAKPQAPLAAQKNVPSTMPFDAPPKQMQTPPYSNSPVQERKVERQPSSHVLEHSLSDDFPQVNKHPPIITMLSSPEGNEPRYQNLDRRFLEGLNLGPTLRPRASNISRTARETKLDSTERGHHLPSDYENVKLSNSQPNSISARHSLESAAAAVQIRKYSEGSEQQMFTQSEGSGSPVFEMMKERAPDSQTRPKNYERSNSGGYNKYTPPHQGVSGRTNIESKYATTAARSRPFLGQLDSDGGMKRSRSYSGSFDHGESLASIDQPLDPNLVCPECGVQFRQGQIQKYRAHFKLCKK